MDCPNCGSANRPDARFCDTCGTRLTPQPAARETRRIVTVVFIDVVGSTALGERLDPEALRARMTEFFDLAREVLERHGGTVEKFIGDAVMAVFGLPVIHEDDALRATRAAGELVRRLEAARERLPIEIRVGVNTGEVVAGDPDAGQRLVTGDAVNVAARLEQAAGAGEVLLGEDTYRLVREAIEADEAPPVQAKGKSEPLVAHRLRSVHADSELAVRRLDAPLVGRDRELTRLLRSYEDAVAESRCGLFTLLGPAGVGKSRLVHELVARVGEAATVLRGRCLPYGEGITYWPIAEIVRGAAGIAEDDARETALARLEALLAGEPEREVITARIATAIGLDEGATDREDVFWAVRRLLEILAARRPVVAIVDDLHWAEPTLLDLVEHVVDWSRNAPILIVAISRPDLLDLRPGWGGGKLDAQTVLLEPLREDDTRELAERLLGGALEPAILSRVAEVAEGNPLFVEQLVAMLVGDGHLHQEDGRWVAAGDLAAVAVPPTIHALLAARLDRLPAEERSVAERASVVGRVFERQAVTVLSPEPEREEVRARLRNLVRRELIRPDPSSTDPEDTFRFRHLLIRDAAYDALPKRDRAELHARFADWLEATMAGRLAEYEEILGHHLEQAVRYREELGLADAATDALRTRAGEHLARAGDRAMDRADSAAAVRLMERAVALQGGPASADRLLALRLGEALLDQARWVDAAAVVSAVAEGARAAADEVAAARADVLLASTTYFVASADAVSLEAATVGPAEILRRHGDELGLAHLSIVLGNVALQLAHWQVAVGHYEDALEHAARAEAHGLLATIPAWTANALVWGPTPASTALSRIEELRASTASRRVAASLTIISSPLLGYLGRLGEGRAAWAAGRVALDELGLGAWYMSGLFLGEIERAAGDHEAAVAALRQGRERLMARDEKGTRSTVEAMLAMSLAVLGRDEEAIEMSRESEANAAPDDQASQMAWRAGRALAYAHLGRLDEALSLAAEAVAIARTTDQHNATAEVTEIQAEVLRLAGRTDEARAALDRAIELFEAKENLPAATRARAAREALAAR